MGNDSVSMSLPAEVPSSQRMPELDREQAHKEPAPDSFDYEEIHDAHEEDYEASLTEASDRAEFVANIERL